MCVIMDQNTRQKFGPVTTYLAKNLILVLILIFFFFFSQSSQIFLTKQSHKTINQCGIFLDAVNEENE